MILHCLWYCGRDVSMSGCPHSCDQWALYGHKSESWPCSTSPVVFAVLHHSGTNKLHELKRARCKLHGIQLPVLLSMFAYR